MYTELYFPRDGKSFSKTTDKDFEGTVKQLSELDINIIYKTEVNLTKESISQALKETSSGEDLIDLIMIADAVKEDDIEKARALLEELGISGGKVKRLEVAQKNENSTKPNEKKRNTIVIEEAPGIKIESPAKPALTLDKGDEPDPVFAGDTAEIETKEADVQNKNIIYAFSVEYNKKLIILLPTEEAVGADFSTILCSISNAVMHPKQKSAFWKRFIPCSGDSPFDVVRKVILLLAICTFIVSSYMLINILIIEPAFNDRTNNSIKDMLVSTDDGSGNNPNKKPIDGSQGILLDFSNLYAENPDTIGWITVPNTVIDYVVVKPQEDKDPEYYLYRDFYGNDTKYGTIFMDYRSKLDSKNLILHGHHMQDGRMFANLKNFEDLDFYKSTPTFTFNTIYEKSEWKIISIFKTNTLDYQGDFFNYLRGSFQNDYDFLNFVYQIRERSIIDCPVSVNENDTLVTLSTCAYDFEEFRFVVVARKVRDGEDTSVDVSKAAKNPDTLYPDIWYNYNGGTKPEVTTFQDAFNNKKISWYDGNRTNWSENDDKDLTKTLDEGKKNAVDLLNKYISSRKFDETDKAAIDNLLKQYIELINSASSGQEVNELYDNALNDFKKFKTISEKEESDKLASAQEVTSKKASAKVELHNSIAGNSYRNEQMEQVNKLFDEYNKKIDAAKTVEDIEKIKKEGIDKLSKIKTNDELTKEEESKKAEESQKAEESRLAEESRKAEESSKAEEARKAEEEAARKAEEARLAEEEASRKAEEARLAEEKLKKARENAITQIEIYAQSNEYYPDQQSEIDSILSKYTAVINGSDDENTINDNVNHAKTDLSKVKTKEQIDSEITSEPSLDPEPEPEPDPEVPDGSNNE